MRFKCKPSANEKANDKRKKGEWAAYLRNTWFHVFAWYPVTAEDGYCYWLEHVWRKYPDAFCMVNIGLFSNVTFYEVRKGEPVYRKSINT